MIKEWEIETVQVADVTPADYNPRKISKEAMEGLTASIERFGVVQPLVINSRTGTLVSGHQRLEVLIETGVKEVAAVMVDLSVEDEKALNVTQNNPLVAGSFDNEGLVALLSDLDTAEYEGFAPLRLDILYDQEMVPDFDPLPEEEEPDPIEPKITQCPECGHEWS